MDREMIGMTFMICAPFIIGFMLIGYAEKGLVPNLENENEQITFMMPITIAIIGAFLKFFPFGTKEEKPNE